MTPLFEATILSKEFIEASRNAPLGCSLRDHRRAMIDMLNRDASLTGIEPDYDDLILQAHFIYGDIDSEEAALRIKKQLLTRLGTPD